MAHACDKPTTLSGEIRPLTGLRIVAALWVVGFHFMFTPGDSYGDVLRPLQPLIQTGALGVDLFYVLSGFVITLTYVESMGRRPRLRTSVRFLWARICRIWPVYALVTVAFGGWLVYKTTIVTDGLVAYQAEQPDLTVGSLLQQLAMVQLWGRPFFDGSSFVGPAWSISAEWAAYACFPLVVLGLWRLRNAPPVVTGLLAVACMTPFAAVCFTTGAPYFPYSWLLRIGMGFLAGAFTCLAVRRVRLTARVDRIAAVVAVLAVAEILVGLWWGYSYGDGAGEYGGVVVLVFPVLVGALALSRRGLSRALSAGPMVHGGRISYSLYLVHVPVFEVLWTAMTRIDVIGPDSAVGSILVPHVFLATIVLAHLLYRFVEEPARLRLRVRGPGRWTTREETVVVDVPGPRATAPTQAEVAGPVRGAESQPILVGSAGAR